MMINSPLLLSALPTTTERAAPSTTAEPTIDGGYWDSRWSVAVGQTATCVAPPAGEWANDPDSYSYEWLLLDDYQDETPTVDFVSLRRTNSTLAAPERFAV